MKDIITVEGKAGLLKVLKYNKLGFIAENIISKERTQVFAKNNISMLSEIQIYTEDDNVELVEVFKSIKEKENGGECLSPKSSSDEIKSYFEEILPDYDKDRVYVSDMKKVLKWYNILQGAEMLNFEEETKEETEKE
jgi:hypothetical protein